MTQRFVRSLISVALTTLVLTGVVLAREKVGHGGGNGGDPVIARMQQIRAFVHMNARQEVLSFFQRVKKQDLADPSTWEAINAMRENGIVADVQESAYVFQITCKEVGTLDGGGSINGDLGGDICLSPKRLAEIDASKAEVVALLVHEHAHHYGYVDGNHAIYKAVLATLHLSQPNWENGEFTPPSPAPNKRKLIRGAESRMYLVALDQGAGSSVFGHEDDDSFWRIERLGTNPKTFKVISENTGLCLAEAAISQYTSEYTDPELYPCNGSARQAFSFYKVGKRWAVQNLDSGKCLRMSPATSNVFELSSGILVTRSSSASFEACTYKLDQLFDIPALEPQP